MQRPGGFARNSHSTGSRIPNALLLSMPHSSRQGDWPVDGKLTLEIISSVASTVMSTVLAVVALVFSYRQNIGWEPVALVSKNGMGGVGQSDDQFLSLGIEFWNRRKYPLNLRALLVRTIGVELTDESFYGPSKDFVKGNLLIRKTETVVGPNESLRLEVELPFRNQSLDAMRAELIVELRYFDPQANKTRITTLKHKHFYPELGWKLTEEERDRVLSAYRATSSSQN